MRLTAANLTAACLAALLWASCKKDDSPPAPGNPATASLVRRAVVFDGADSSAVVFHYGADSLVDTIDCYEGAFMIHRKVFEHTPGRVVAYPEGMAGVMLTDTTWMDAAGRPTRTVQLLYSNMLIEWLYMYNSAGLLDMTIHKDYFGPDADTTFHTWSGGNMTSAMRGVVGEVSYTYDLSKPFLRGEPKHLDALQAMGYNTRPSANMLTSITTDGQTVNYTYQYDALGRIMQYSNGVHSFFIYY